MADAYERTTFSRRLKALREERGMTQRDLADASGVKLNSIARYETAEIIPRADKVFDMAQALDCSIDVLMGRVQLIESK